MPQVCLDGQWGVRGVLWMECGGWVWGCDSDHAKGAAHVPLAHALVGFHLILHSWVHCVRDWWFCCQ